MTLSRRTPGQRRRRFVALDKLVWRAIVIAGLAVLPGCQGLESLGPMFHQAPSVEPQPIARSAKPETVQEPSNRPPEMPAARTELIPGTGVVINETPPATENAKGVEARAGSITLNFVDADIHSVLPRVLGDVLHVNFTIDPKVQAHITLQTSQPLRRADVLPALQEALRASGLELVDTASGIYRLVPLAEAPQSGSLPVIAGKESLINVPTRPYSVMIVPLKFASASSLKQTLDPYLPKGAVLQVDAARNLLILSGAGVDLSTVSDMVAAFDINWIKGMSFAIVPVQTAAPKAVVDQLEQIFGSGGSVPLPGVLRFEPLDRMNAVLVASPQPAYIEQARQWIDRLDRGESESRPQIYEYDVQNSRATDLARVLNRLLSTGAIAPAAPETAPGTSPATLGSSAMTLGTISGGTAVGPTGPTTVTNLTQTPGGTVPSGSLNARAGRGLAGSTEPSRRPEGAPAAPGELEAEAAPPPGLEMPAARIVADDKNNTLLIYARPRTYRLIERALERIDRVPLQVLIEATVAEVTLGNDLQYGLQYFFQTHSNQFTFGSTQTPLVGQGIAGIFPGFNYILNRTNMNVVLNLLSSITHVHVVSAPELLVLDHHAASLLVGNQIPIPTAQIQSTVTSGAPLVSTIQYVDTGVILKVTPRVNVNGIITLDIAQEVSAVANANQNAATAALGPTISQRRIESTITVEDGETVALGGLIQDTNSVDRTGLPVLSDLPGIGWLFRSTDHSVQRTELLVFLSPRILHDPTEARAATAELRARLHDLRQKYDVVP